MAIKAYHLDKRVLKDPTINGVVLSELQNTLNLKEYVQAVIDDSQTDFTSINVDTINESTADHGVIVDGVLLKDGVVTSTGINTYSTTVGITAFAGGGQGSAVALTSEYNTIGVCATAGDSVKLPTPAVGKLVTVFNGGAADLAVFPVTGGTIGGLSANASITLPSQAVKYFLGVSGTAWALDGRLLAVEDGTVGIPSITFDNNSDTGLYKVSGTQTGFSSNGTLVGGFNNSGLFTDVVAEQTSAAGVTIDGVIIKDGGVTIVDGSNIIFGSSFGALIGTANTQKFGFWNTLPKVQPTTAVTSAVNVGGAGTTVKVDDTFDGYTLAQVVKALRSIGLLA